MKSFQSMTCLCLAALMLAACGPQAESVAATQPAAGPAEGQAAQFADVVVRDARVYTLDPQQPWAEAVAIRDGLIVLVGTNAQAEELTGPDTKMLSQPGGLVLPAFQDAHAHPYTSGLDYFDCSLDILPSTVQTYLDKVSECKTSMADREWIFGGGWQLTAFAPSGIPDKALLDQVISDHPVLFYSVDGHTAWANSRALEIAGITSETPDPPNGRIDRNPATGEVVGSFQESAMDLIRKHVPPPPASQREAGMRRAIDYLHSLGITAMQEAAASADPQDPLQALETYRSFADNGELQMHTVISLLWDDEKGLEQIPRIVAARDRYTGGLITANTVKFHLDGVVEPHTAAMLQDYTDQPGYKGELKIAPEIFNEAVAQLDAQGFQVQIHVIGDAAVRAALDAFEFALKRNGPTNGRHHLAHVEFVDPADIARFAELNVTATFSPLWAFEDAYLTELTLPRVGPERYRWTYPINSIVQAKGRVAFGSDWNVSSPDPLLAIETAVTRIEALEGKTPVFMPQERLSLEDAVAAATINAAYVNHLDDSTGSIAMGKRGDIVILDTNLFEIEPAGISGAKVVATLFGGEVVYARQE